MKEKLFDFRKAAQDEVRKAVAEILPGCADCISRQAALDALGEAMPSLTTPDGCGQFDHDIQVTDEAYVDCMRIIHDLPSADSELEKKIRAIGYTGKEGRINIHGRVFAVRELPQ